MSDKVLDAGDARFWTREGTLDWENVEEYRSGHWAACDHRATDRWLDAGAHIGTFAVYAAARSAFVVAVEPDEDNHRLLLANLQLNEVCNARAVRAALVGNDDRQRPFFLNVQKNKGTHTFYRRGHFAKVDVPCLNVNDVLREHDVNCIEMDVEGAEVELLHAVEDWGPIRQLYLEYHDHILGKEGLPDVMRFLGAHFGSVEIDPAIKHRWWRIVVARKEL